VWQTVDLVDLQRSHAKQLRVRERSVLLWDAASGDFGPYTISASTEDATINSGAYAQLLKQKVIPHFTASFSHPLVNQSRVAENWIN